MAMSWSIGAQKITHGDRERTRRKGKQEIKRENREREIEK